MAAQNALLSTSGSRIDRAVASARHNGVWQASAGDRLEEIAALLLPDDPALQQRLIGDLRRSYPKAIADHDTGDLRHGSLIKLPDYVLVVDAGAPPPQAIAGKAKSVTATRSASTTNSGDAAGGISAVVATVVDAGAGLRASGADGRVRKLFGNGILIAGETLISGPGHSQLLLIDGTRLSLRPRSALLIGAAPSGSAAGDDTASEGGGDQPADSQSNTEDEGGKNTAWQMQLLRGGLRLQRDVAAPFGLLVRSAELRSHTRDLSLRVCSAVCEDSRGKRYPAGVYALLGNGELQLRSPAGEQRFAAGHWLHLPSSGEPAIALSDPPGHDFAVPNGETSPAPSEIGRLDARTLARYSKRLTALVYQAISSVGISNGTDGMGISPEDSERSAVLSFVPGTGTGGDLTRGQRDGDTRLWVESSQPLRQLPGLRRTRSLFNVGRSIKVPEYGIRSPSLPPANDPLWVEDALGRERPAATFGGLCLGGRCDQARSPGTTSN